MTTSTVQFDAKTIVAALEGMDQRSFTVNDFTPDKAPNFFSGGATATDRPGNPFMQVGVVNRCVRVIADAVKSMPLMISTTNDEIIESGPVIDFFDNPYPRMTGDELIAWTVALMMLTRGAYWVIEAREGRMPSRVRVVSALHCVAYYGSDGDVAWYNYTTPGSGHTARLSVDDVIPLLRENFADERLRSGTSAIEPARMAIDQVYAADISNLASLNNGIDPGLAFEFPGKPSDDLIKDMRQQLDDRHRGPSRRNRPIFLYEGMKIADFVKKFVEMEFSTLKKMSVADICVAFGVPPLVIGYSGDGSLGQGKESEEAHVVFWQTTVLPLAQWLAGKITTHILSPIPEPSRILSAYVSATQAHRKSPWYAKSRAIAARRRGPGERHKLFAWFDASGIKPVMDMQLRLMNASTVLITNGIPLNQVIRAYDLPFQEQPWGDTWWKPMGLVDVQSDQSMPGSQDPSGPDPDPAGKPDPDPIDDPADPNDKNDDPVKAFILQRDTQAQLERIWLAWRASWAPYESRMASLVSRHFMELRGQVLAKLGTENKAFTRATVGTILFDLVEANNSLIAKVGPLVRETYNLGGSQAMDEAAAAQGPGTKPNEFNIADPRVQSAMRQRNIRITETNKTLRRNLAESLAEGVADQETTAQLAERIRKQFNLASGRAATIARTEVGGAMEDARQQGRSQSRTPKKSWLWSRKETGRQNHLETEIETLATPVPNADDFVIAETGNATPYPRGPKLPADDSVNCGCTTLARYDGDNLKSVLNLYLSRGFLRPDTLAVFSARCKEAA